MKFLGLFSGGIFFQSLSGFVGQTAVILLDSVVRVAKKILSAILLDCKYDVNLLLIKN